MQMCLLFSTTTTLVSTRGCQLTRSEIPKSRVGFLSNFYLANANPRLPSVRCTLLVCLSDEPEAGDLLRWARSFFSLYHCLLYRKRLCPSVRGTVTMNWLIE